MLDAQELRRRGASQPTKLYVSAARAPHLAAVHHDIDSTPELHKLPFNEFWKSFERRYGCIPELVRQALNKGIDVHPPLYNYISALSRNAWQAYNMVFACHRKCELRILACYVSLIDKTVIFVSTVQ